MDDTSLENLPDDPELLKAMIVSIQGGFETLKKKVVTISAVHQVEKSKLQIQLDQEKQNRTNDRLLQLHGKPESARKRL